MYVEDQLGLMDHLGIDRFLVTGCRIGCSFILKLVERQYAQGRRWTARRTWSKESSDTQYQAAAGGG